MKIFHYFDEPLKIYGLVDFEKDRKLQRVPDALIEKMPSLAFLGRRCPGARLEFKTNASEFKLTLSLKTLSVDVGMPLTAVQALAVFAGPHTASRFLGLVRPNDYEHFSADKVFQKGNAELEDIEVWLPRNEWIEDITLEIPEDAEVFSPTPYKYEKPVVFYGSSITEGGCSSGTYNCYNALISRWLDTDYLNFGFSAAAKGETEMADFLRAIPMSVFVYDYDHNAPNPEHLKATHEPFFQRFREAQPETPVVMLTRPDYTHYSDDTAKRRDIVRETYENALKNGDRNVYFIDGTTFFSETDAPIALMDTCHPNDLGFYRMAEKAAPVIRKILEEN